VTVKCNRCGREIADNKKYEYHGQTLCEDCYIDMTFQAKACDPWAVYSATRSRQRTGFKNAEGLTDLQRAIYEFIKSSGRVSKEELLKNFNLSESELQAQLATLRHCELVKGFKEDGRIYAVPFD
jgi:hypothetical protein